MLDVPARRTFRWIVLILVGVSAVTLALVVTSVLMTRPLTARQANATLTVAARLRYTTTPVPTPVPTLPGVRPELLLCQRQAGQAMQARGMAGAVNLSDDRQITFHWVSPASKISGLDSALAGVISSLDVALEVWQDGCTVFDRVQIEVYDREGQAQIHRLRVTAQMSDALRWRAGEIDDAALLGRLAVVRIEDEE
jgi:hypothetical protein